MKMIHLYPSSSPYISPLIASIISTPINFSLLSHSIAILVHSAGYRSTIQTEIRDVHHEMRMGMRPCGERSINDA